MQRTDKYSSIWMTRKRYRLFIDLHRLKLSAAVYPSDLVHEVRGSHRPCSLNKLTIRLLKSIASKRGVGCRGRWGEGVLIILGTGTKSLQKNACKMGKFFCLFSKDKFKSQLMKHSLLKWAFHVCKVINNSRTEELLLFTLNIFCIYTALHQKLKI